MIREKYVKQRVLDVYECIQTIQYPFRPEDVAKLLPVPCHFIRYQDAAKISNCSVDEVAELNQSTDAVTHLVDGVYIIMYNEIETSGRMLWSKCHELGHVILGHFGLIQQGMAEQEAEEEADYFARTLMAPFPIMRQMGIGSVDQTIQTYGFSKEAGGFHFGRYRRWESGHIKTAWDSRILAAWKQKGVA